MNSAIQQSLHSFPPLRRKIRGARLVATPLQEVLQTVHNAKTSGTTLPCLASRTISHFGGLRFAGEFVRYVTLGQRCITPVRSRRVSVKRAMARLFGE